MAKTYNVEIRVDSHIERSLRQLKKRIEREGVVRDMKRQVYFEPPTQKRRKKMMRAIKTNILKSMSTDK
jgi:small subunit ribosomal protein S21